MRILKRWTLAAAIVSAGAGVASVQNLHAAATPAEDPVAVARRALVARYAENDAAYLARDAGRVIRLRHPEFQTIAPDGTVAKKEEADKHTREFIGKIDRFDSMTDEIKSLTLEGDKAHAIVEQKMARRQHMGDVDVHEIKSTFVQRESWIKTPDGWLLWRIDQIQPGDTFMDGELLPKN